MTNFTWSSTGTTGARTHTATAAFSTTYFARCRVFLADGAMRTGFVSFHIEGSRHVPESLMVFGASPFLVPLDGSPRQTGPLPPQLFPLRYEVRVEAEGGTPLEWTASVDPHTPPPKRPAPADAYDLVSGLGPLKWSDDEAALSRRCPDARREEMVVAGHSLGSTYVVDNFLEVEGVALSARVSTKPERVEMIALQPPPSLGPGVDLALVQRTLARRLCADEPLRQPGLNRWTTAGCQVMLISHDATHFACIVTAPRASGSAG